MHAHTRQRHVTCERWTWQSADVTFHPANRYLPSHRYIAIHWAYAREQRAQGCLLHSSEWP